LDAFGDWSFGDCSHLEIGHILGNSGIGRSENGRLKIGRSEIGCSENGRSEIGRCTEKTVFKLKHNMEETLSAYADESEIKQVIEFPLPSPLQTLEMEDTK
jgi:hypothetical protein